MKREKIPNYPVNIVREKDGKFVVQDPKTGKMISGKLRFTTQEAVSTWLNSEKMRPGIIIHRKFDDLKVTPIQQVT
jgi:hypothetical protein